MKAYAIVRKLVEEDHNYRTTVPTDVSGLDGWDTDGKPTLAVTWLLDIDAREWGVKTMLPVVTGIVGNIALTAYGETADQHKDLPISWKSGDKTFEVESTNSQSGDSIFPREVEIDLKRNRIVVTF